MIFSNRIKTLLLLTGDLLLFYLSLYFALSLRYLSFTTSYSWGVHQLPFFYIHILWLFVFYINNLYDIKSFGSLKIILKRAARALIIITILTAIIFYLVPAFGITPKTILFIDIAILSALLILWRRLFWSIARKGSKIKILFFGSSKEVEKITEHLKNNPQIGYEPTVVLSSVEHNIAEIIKKQNIQLIVASENIMRSKNVAKRFYEVIPLGVSIINFPNFYEIIRGKIPVSIINEIWFLENLMEINQKPFEITKKIFDFVFALVLIIPTLILTPFIALLIKIESRGPVFYKQKRIGKNNKIFEIIKFRSMRENAEENGAMWAQKKDSRITKIGRILRKTRIDEFPQLLNILKGDMSFIGPRPERPEFVKTLEKEIPHYAIRHLVKPGASGWAQINYPYGASINDALKKLQYDLYYIKNRSKTLDFSILVKTIMVMLKSAGR